MIIAMGLILICTGASLFLIIGASLIMDEGTIELVPMLFLSLFPVMVGLGLLMS